MALKFYGISVPISIVIATAYFYYVTQYKPNQKRQKLFKELDVKVSKKPSDCELTAAYGDIVHVHYTSYMKSSGKQFESTKGKDPYTFKLGTCNDKALPECLKGIQTALLGMCTGEKRKVTIPPGPKHGYDRKAKPAALDKNEKLLFHLEMVDIDKDAEA
eukprot:TRINITY_DN69473_c0_g1_i1.p2 TRINITY_DN69473_c0_g1~~TRINITY_DN69473_c0_g1_i1.p2  ORF type:complete len:160 (-),score=37.20 TRINITY_DN69473_c0_g1_i1:65-544(-)